MIAVGRIGSSPLDAPWEALTRTQKDAVEACINRLVSILVNKGYLPSRSYDMDSQGDRDRVDAAVMETGRRGQGVGMHLVWSGYDLAAVARECPDLSVLNSYPDGPLHDSVLKKYWWAFALGGLAVVGGGVYAFSRRRRT